MRHTLFIIVSSLFLATAIADTSRAKCQYNEAKAKDAAKAVSNLASKLYQKISSDKPTENAIFSPVSIALALALVEKGAAGTILSEIQTLLGSSNGNESYQSLQHQLQIKTDKSKLSIANGLFYVDNLKFKDDYLREVNCFETEITKEPFETDPDGARRKINQWVSKNTADKIPELFKSGTIDQATVAVLANAVYLKAAWQDQFKKTEDGTFYIGGKTNQVRKVPFMIRQDDYSYSSTDDAEVVELPYAEAPLSMFIILPKQRDGLQSVEQSLTGDKLVSLLGQTQSSYVSLKLPKFTIRLSVGLKLILEQLGLKQMFTDQADFSRMAETGMKVSDAIHEAYIKVDENGTEAAAATGIQMTLLSAALPPPPPIPFVADHPFIFAIVHKPTSAITFMGKVYSVQP